MTRAPRMREGLVTCTMLIGAAVAPSDGTVAAARDGGGGHVRARLVADVRSVRPGVPFWAGVRFEMDAGWHLNWINPGDAGLAPSISWRLPAGFTAGELVWPYPSAFRVGPLAIFGYDGTLLLAARVTPPADLTGVDGVTIGADVDWLACEEGCVPGRAELALELPVARSGPAASRWRDEFDAARDDEPLPAVEWRVQAFVEDEERYVLEVRATDADDVSLAACTFFPLEPDVVEHAAPQSFHARHGGFDLVLQRARMSLEVPPRIAGVLVADPGWDAAGKRRAIAVDVVLEPR